MTLGSNICVVLIFFSLKKVFVFHDESVLFLQFQKVYFVFDSVKQFNFLTQVAWFLV